MAEQVGKRAASKLDVRTPSLVNAIINCAGFQLGGFCLEPSDMVGGKQIRQKQIAFNFDLVNSFAQCQGGPVTVINTCGVHCNTSFGSRSYCTR